MERYLKVILFHVFNLIIIFALGSGCADDSNSVWQPDDPAKPYSSPLSATVGQFIEEDPPQGPFPSPKLKLYVNYQASLLGQPLTVKDTSYQEVNDAYVIILRAFPKKTVDHNIWVSIAEIFKGRFDFTWKILGETTGFSYVNGSRYTICQFVTTRLYHSPFKIQLKISYTEPDHENWEYTYSTYVFIRWNSDIY